MSTTPKYFYHYTDINGAYGILNSETLWASQIQYLNDYREVKHAYDVFARLVLNRHVMGFDFPDEFLRSAMPPVENFHAFRTFVFSLTENGNQLSQWRAYGKQAGISLGFPFSALESAARNSRFELVKCIYDGSEIRRIFEQSLPSLKSKRLALKEEGKSWEELKVIVSQNLYSEVVTIAPRAKDASFSEEEEWRLVGGPFTTHAKPVRWRPAATTLLPYWEIPLQLPLHSEHNPLNSEYKEQNKRLDIIVGPSPNEHLTVSSLHNFLTNRNIAARVKSSKIPYRVM